MASRVILVFALLVAISLPSALLLAPSLYVQPTSTHSYAIAHESTTVYNETVEQTDLDTNATTPLADLPPKTRQAFADAAESGDSHAGWQANDVTVCHELSPVCNGYDDPPEFPEDADASDERPSAYGLVDDDGDVYAVETQSDGNLGFGSLLVYPAVLLPILLSFVLYGLYLAMIAIRYYDTHATRVLGSAGDGLIFLAWPFFVMIAGVTDTVLFVLLPLTVLPLGAIVGSSVISLLKKYV